MGKKPDRVAEIKGIQKRNVSSIQIVKVVGKGSKGWIINLEVQSEVATFVLIDKRVLLNIQCK